MRPLKRLFLVMPLMILFICLSLTVVIPILYWVFTGEAWFDLIEEIIWLGES
jgi:peptidoglycan/LPS O-acetylase OafA/YrhL